MNRLNGTRLSLRTATTAALLVQPLAVQGQDAADLRIQATFIAKETCSDRFVAGLGPDLIREDMVRFTPLGLVASVDSVDKRVAVGTPDGSVYGRAIFRPSLGCVMLNADSSLVFELGRQMAALPLQPSEAATNVDTSDAIGTRVGYSESTSIDRSRIDAAVEGAFSEPDPENPQRTRAVVVVHDGRIVAERYAPGVTPATALRGWSMAKSVTAALVGVMIEQGRMDLLAPLPVPEWSEPDDPRGRISLMQMLEMSSGLEFDESYGAGATDVANLLFNESDAGGFAAAKPLVERPGSTYRYSSGTTNIISRATRALMRDDQAYWRFPQEDLFDRIDVTSMVLETDPSGTFVGSSYAWATARDWARLGQLFLQNGVWDGVRVLPDGWARYVATPTPSDPNAGFGAHFATNAGGRWPSVPRDLFLMSGLDGQYVFIAPSHRAVVVRLGQTLGDGFDAEALIGGILSALPEALIPVPTPPTDRPDTTRVLLIGNSYTYMNNLPDILAGISAGLPTGPLLEGRSVVRGAARLAWHAEAGNVEAAFERDAWDVVVLQEQSRLLPVVAQMTPEQIADPTQALGSPAHFHDAVRTLVPVIRSYGARPVLFETWARRSRPEETQTLADAYGSIGQDLGVDVAPVGQAWAKSTETRPERNLYWFDQRHPGPAGSYLAALVLYATITGQDPRGAPSRVVGQPTLRDGTVDDSRYEVLVDLPTATAGALQAIAWDLVSQGRR